ncbi:glycosyltransferase [Actinophytocola gossypii]|uniref:Glycosyltransferase n=1 Tax=Actinophytocola gossypii TaxID=2812003 RepID=A0ABT2JG25_9PSEU|nr:glycosyltransferase [Actinophytocola gossypii]MCT2586239.1 glycosyltransferase [Actinophytocola gossypii]
MPRHGPRSSAPVLRTAPVLAVLVCHDGEDWLPAALAALRASTPRPRHVLAVDTGSLDATPRLLDDAAGGAEPVLHGVLTLDRGTGFAAAVHAAVAVAVERWGDQHDGWIWVLHDDSAPEPDCLATLLSVADASPAAGVLGPLALDWHDPRLVVEAGLSTDASGHRQTGIGPSELDWDRLGRGHRYGQSTEVLAVPSAGLLVRRELWSALGGFDPAIPLLREDIDFGWRANWAGSVVLCVPSARLRHVRAVPTGVRGAGAARAGGSVRAVDRAQGLRTFLVNCSTFSFLVGLPRLAVLCVVRALGFAMQRRLDDCRAELRALGYVLGGRAGLRAARASRRGALEVRSVRGLFTSRLTRLRNTVGAAVAHLVRRRVEADAALGRLPDTTDGDAVLLPAEPAVPLVGPQALPAGAGGRPRRTAGLRRPTTSVGVPVELPNPALPDGFRPSPGRRPSPVPRDGSRPAPPDLVLVRVDRARLARQVLLAPPVLLVTALLAFGLVANADRLGLDLAGGRLLPVPDLAATWAAYLDTWHPVAGGTAAPAPAALAVLGVLGAVFAPLGGPAAAVAVLFLGSLPLAGLGAYVATRRLPVHRWVRALVAAAYALLPPGTEAVAHGRLDVVVAHVLLPPVTAGIVALLGRARTDSARWLSTAATSAIGLAVLGAFTPLVHLLLVAYALAGFVLVPGRRGDGRRRVTALFVLVLMPLALLLPWPAVLIQHPGVVLHGVGAVGVLGGPLPWTGLVVVVAVLAGLVIRPGRAVLPGLALALLGALAVTLVLGVPAAPVTGGPAETGWPGAPLLVAGWGLLHALLATCRARPPASRATDVLPQPASRTFPSGESDVPGTYDSRAGTVRLARRDRTTRGGGGGVGRGGGGVLAVGAFVGRVGPLDDAGGLGLATTLDRELAETGRGVLVLPRDGEPARMTAGRLPMFGDDALPPVDAGVSLARLVAGFGDAEQVPVAVADAAAAGVLFVVAPDAGAGEVIADAAGDLVAGAPATEDGRPVLRLQPAAGQVTLLSPEQARRAITGSPPPTELGAPGIVPVDAWPPSVAVRVSDGPGGRLLVVAAEEEPGWRATVDGREVPVVRAWGHLVGVPLGTSAAEVRVEQPTALRGVLLLIQAAMALFVLLTAIPGRRQVSRRPR